MSILVLSSSLAWGGTESWVLNIGSFLAKRGHTVFIGERGGLFSRRIAEQGFPRGLETKRFLSANDADLHTVLSLYRFIRGRQVDVVVATKVRDYWLGGLACSLARVPLVMRLGILRSIERKLKNKLVYGRFARAILVNTEAVKAKLLSSGFIDGSKVFVVHNGVDLSRFQVRGRKKDDPRLVIGYVGSLIKRKNVDLLLEVFAGLAKGVHGNRLSLWIVGDGPERVSLEKRAKELGVADRVKFLGARSEVHETLPQMDLLVLLSEMEGFPNVCLEAMACGVPVVVARFPGIDEVIVTRGNGIIVDAPARDEVSRAIEELLTDETLRREIALKGHETVTREFSLEVMGLRTEELLARMVRTQVLR